jgi:hypothetical protein
MALYDHSVFVFNDARDMADLGVLSYEGEHLSFPHCRDPERETANHMPTK